ncbi:hypothetical protein DSL72_005468 [Monilinia vaccinii-corymbosi]|uniref:Uncharacterized protein n=1 Tax=Monilinia vaccinii-corymbosi TaxID=61207 RepID=A0A8A3PFS5_9HELO|nr:hypothetical protein DSL72_005468 [Monilinia vaccinii-corymbosi]
MQFTFPLLAAVFTALLSSSSYAAVLKGSSFLSQPSTEAVPSVELVEGDESFDHYETITHLMSSLHGRIGINDDAMITHGLGRQEPHDIDPKDLKLVSANDLKDYDDAEWVKINGEAVTVHCGGVDVATTGGDWALMQRCPEEEVAIRRLMATFNEEGHQFIVSNTVLQMATKIQEGTYRCIKPSCPIGPLALSVPTASAMILGRAITASRTHSYFPEVTATTAATVSELTVPLPQIDSQPTTFSAVMHHRASENLLLKSQDENEFPIREKTEAQAEEPPEEPTEQLPLGRWLSIRHSDDPYITDPRPECIDPPKSFTLSGKVRTFHRNPRKTSYTTISWSGFTTISTVPHDPNRPPPRPSVVTPDWATASFFQTFSCREAWMHYFNMDRYWKRDIVKRVLEDLQAAARR